MEINKKSTGWSPTWGWRKSTKGPLNFDLHQVEKIGWLSTIFTCIVQENSVLDAGNTGDMMSYFPTFEDQNPVPLVTKGTGFWSSKVGKYHITIVFFPPTMRCLPASYDGRAPRCLPTIRHTDKLQHNSVGAGHITVRTSLKPPAGIRSVNEMS